MKLKYSKPVIVTALAVSATILLPLANGINTKEEMPSYGNNSITQDTYSGYKVEEPIVTTTVAPSTTVALPTTTTEVTPTTTLVPPDTKCAELAPIAQSAGWPQELLVDILKIAWRESRCQNIIKGDSRWNGADSGPLQINEVWHNEINDKYGDWKYVNDPYYNFAWAWEMYIWFDAHKGCGFIPWSKPCK